MSSIQLLERPKRTTGEVAGGPTAVTTVEYVMVYIPEPLTVIESLTMSSVTPLESPTVSKSTFEAARANADEAIYNEP